MDPEGLWRTLVDTARGMGIIDISAAPADGWDTDPLVSSRIGKGHRPKDIMPNARSVVVIGVPVQKSIVDTAPSIYYNHLYSVVNGLLDQASERIALELNALGHRAIYAGRASDSAPRPRWRGRDIPRASRTSAGAWSTRHPWHKSEGPPAGGASQSVRSGTTRGRDPPRRRSRP